MEWGEEMTRSAIFACFMCFVIGGCLGIFVTISASRPCKKVLAGWFAYLLVVTALAFRIGGALIL